MRAYVILTNRKRAIIALAHTVVFLAVAAAGFATHVTALAATSPRSAWALAAIYLAVSIALASLAVLSGNPRERLYFALCLTSAAAGLARQIVGDAHFHAAVYLRVAALACAMVAGHVILRHLRRPAATRA